MEEPKVLTITELVHLGRPLTATSSLHPPHRSLPISPQPSAANQGSKPSWPPPTPPGSTQSNSNSNPNPNPDPDPKVLTPLNHPAIIIGTLNLPTNGSISAPNPNPWCPHNSCFQFSDASATICCDILDLDVRILGKKIHVLAWNFVPLKRGGGFLEIIKWSFPEFSGRLGQCSNIHLFPLASGSSTSSEDCSKARYLIHGVLESVSPVNVVPCGIGVNSSTSVNVQGFLVEVMVCECKLCTSKTWVRALNDSFQEQGQSSIHSYSKRWFVYFCGFASSWHPVITKLIGNVITVLGLKKKLVYIEKEESRLMYVTTEKSSLDLPRLPTKWVSCEKKVTKGKGECGSYKGTIRGVYMRGMVIELDNEVWLLLTDHIMTAPHSLRVGAFISVRNVHFMNPKFSWKKMLILGACFKTSITVEYFSPLESGCHVSQSVRMLGKFVDTLVFPARLWVLLVVSCFRKKYAGTIFEKEILGTKHKEGLAQGYARLHLPSSMFLSRHGVFMALFKHDQCGCGSELYAEHLKLVIPILGFIQHCEATWMRILQLENDSKKFSENNQFSVQSCEGRFYNLSVRKILRGKDIGILLLGNLKICPSSGRLQLVDETGSVDVLIPDLPSTWNANSIYEVTDYRVVIEGIPHLTNHFGLFDNKESVSCRSIFRSLSQARETGLVVYIYFHWGKVTCRNVPFYPSIDWKDDVKKLEGGAFHLLYVTHKFPVPHKFHRDPALSDRTRLFVEALILPWDLFVVGEGVENATKVSREQLEEPMEHGGDENYQEHVSSKKRKIDPALIRKELTSCNLSSDKISCLVTVRGVNGNCPNSSGILSYRRPNLDTGGGCRPGAQKVLLEFKSESFLKYQVLHIGGYYITKHHGDDSFCNIKDSTSVKLISSATHLWSLSYASDEVILDNRSSHHRTLDSSFLHNEGLWEDQIEHLEVSSENSPTTSDVHLYLAANEIGVLEVNLEGLEEGLFEPVVTRKENASWSIGSPDSNCLFPEGNLSSIQGQVVAVHSIDASSVNALKVHESLGVFLQSRSFQRTIKSFCIHVLVDHDMVKIFGSQNELTFPIGFGPGTYATFHRVLELGAIYIIATNGVNFSGVKEAIIKVNGTISAAVASLDSRLSVVDFKGKSSFMLTPVTFVVVNTISVVSESYRDSHFNFQSPSDLYNDASPDPVSSGHISELIQCSDCKPMQFHCRVVAIQILVLEKKVKHGNLQSEVPSRPSLVDIPLACFVLDDGSSSCLCWANSNRAATLLRLHEKLPQTTSARSGWTLNCAGRDDNACSSAICRLESIFKNHDRITVKNYGSMFDSSCQDLVVSTSPASAALSTSDENILKSIILNASFGTYWTVVARGMDSSTVWQLGREHLTEVEMTAHVMQSIWAREVCHTNPLTDGRNMIQELLRRLFCMIYSG